MTTYHIPHTPPTSTPSSPFLQTHTQTVAMISDFQMVNQGSGGDQNVHMGGGGHMFGLQMSYFEATVCASIHTYAHIYISAYTYIQTCIQDTFLACKCPIEATVCASIHTSLLQASLFTTPLSLCYTQTPYMHTTILCRCYLAVRSLAYYTHSLFTIPNSLFTTQPPHMHATMLCRCYLAVRSRLDTPVPHLPRPMCI